MHGGGDSLINLSIAITTHFAQIVGWLRVAVRSHGGPNSRPYAPTVFGPRLLLFLRQK